MTIAHHHTRSIGPTADALREAFRLSCELLQFRYSDTMGMALHTKAQLESTVGDALGDELVKGLGRNNCMQLKGITIQLLMEKIQIRKLDVPSLASFVSPDEFYKNIGCQGVTELVFVPWESAELQAHEAAFFDSLPLCAAPRDGTLVARVQEA